MKEFCGNKAFELETVKDLKKFLENYSDETLISNCYQTPGGGGLISTCFVAKYEPYRDSEKDDIIFIINDPAYSCG